jgi:hypothetical protein
MVPSEINRAISDSLISLRLPTLRDRMRPWAIHARIVHGLTHSRLAADSMRSSFSIFTSLLFQIYMRFPWDMQINRIVQIQGYVLSIIAMKYETIVSLRAASQVEEILRILNGAHVRREEQAGPDLNDDDIAESDKVEYGNLQIELWEDAIRTERQRQEKLRQYVDSWIGSGLNVGSWERCYPVLFQEINRQLGKLRLHLGIQGNWKAKVFIDKPFLPKGHSDLDAAQRFASLVTGPLADRIGKCKRCQQYFAALKGAKNKVFCSRKCATGLTALNSTRARRKRERREKIVKCHQALVEYRKGLPRKQDWKRFVAKKAGVTVKWLTRAVNRREITPPRKDA